MPDIISLDAVPERSVNPSGVTSPAPVVEVTALGRRFGKVVAVAGISFNVAPGEMFALIGPNGAGKSTLMKMLTTLLPPTSGSARIAGYDLRHQAGLVRRHIGYVPQLPSSDTELTGAENMQLSARLYLIPRAERESRIAEALARMELTQVKDRRVGTYSGGMMRRLEIAQSMLHRPAVLFLDEPTVGLDPSGRLAVWRDVRRINREMGTAVIFSTHYMEEAADVAHRVALVSQGRVAAIGSVSELLAQYRVASLDQLFTTVTGGNTGGEASS